jgi:phage tail sheath gpL-like
MYDQMPITASSGGAGIVNLTTKETNAEANTQLTNIWQNTDNLDAALTAALNTAATPATGTLSLTTILAAAATTRYNYIVTRCSDSTNLGLLETHLDTYAAPLPGKRQQGIAGSMDTPANQITLAQAVNAWRVQILGCELFQEQHYEIAAAWAAHRQFEEASDAGTAYKFYPLSSVKIPRLETQYMTSTEEEAAVNAGITPVSVRNAQAFIPRSITSRIPQT